MGFPNKKESLNPEVTEQTSATAKVVVSKMEITTQHSRR